MINLQENQKLKDKTYDTDFLNTKRMRRAAEFSNYNEGNTEPSTMRSRRIERFKARQFSLPFETTEFALPSTMRKGGDSVERKFREGKSIHVDDVKDYVIPSLENFIQKLTENLTEADLNKTITEEEREIDSVSEKYQKEFAGDIPGFNRDYDGNLVPTHSPAEIQRQMDEFDKERIEYMRKARGEFDR